MNFDRLLSCLFAGRAVLLSVFARYTIEFDDQMGKLIEDLRPGICVSLPLHDFLDCNQKASRRPPVALREGVWNWGKTSHKDYTTCSIGVACCK